MGDLRPRADHRGERRPRRFRAERRHGHDLAGLLGVCGPIRWRGRGVERVQEGQAKAADSQWMLTGSYIPGDLGFDPLGLYTIFGKSESGKMLMETAEIKNGRLAMLAITIYALEEAITKNPVV